MLSSGSGPSDEDACARTDSTAFLLRYGSTPARRAAAALTSKRPRGVHVLAAHSRPDRHAGVAVGCALWAVLTAVGGEAVL